MLVEYAKFDSFDLIHVLRIGDKESNWLLWAKNGWKSKLVKKEKHSMRFRPDKIHKDAVQSN